MVTTMMTIQFVLPFVHGQGHIAALALRNPSASAALPHRRKTPAILEENNLTI
jgi:hypothetical protein